MTRPSHVTRPSPVFRALEAAVARVVQLDGIFDPF
jgi:hypothetical protein